MTIQDPTSNSGTFFLMGASLLDSFVFAYSWKIGLAVLLLWFIMLVISEALDNE